MLAAAAFAVVSMLGSGRAAPTGAAASLAAALSNGRLATLRFANTSGERAAARWKSIEAGMRGATASVRLLATSTRGDAALARLRWRWRLPFGHRWTYATDAQLRYRDGRWEPLWSPRLVSSRLTSGETLGLSLRLPARAQILTSDGQPIIQERQVVNVGIEPSRVRNLPLLLRELHADLGISTAPLLHAVRAAAPTAFVPVVTLRLAQYNQVASEIYPLPGTVFSTGRLPLAPDRFFAESLLGVTGRATAAAVRASSGRRLPGETIGLSGLEQAFDARLAGTPGVAVRARGGQGSSETLYARAPKPGQPLETTLVASAQVAADAALAGVTQQSALVAIDITSGDVIAVSVGPDPGGYDTALQGEYPPGSTFKIATTLALLEQGEQPTTTVQCPAEIVVDGKPFHNAEHELIGPESFAQAFANSCNTAFIGLAPQVAGSRLPAAARALGIGRRFALGLPSYPGSIPIPQGPVELAAEAFGQGQDLVSPLALAAAAAAVARGRWIAPRLLLSPALRSPPPGPPIPAAVAATLQTLMRDVVTSGTGSALAGQPGLPVYGKTGTAETGTQNPPLTDAWFIGFQGNVAFAALVANTKNGFGGTLAAPIVGRFLAQLDQ